MESRAPKGERGEKTSGEVADKRPVGAAEAALARRGSEGAYSAVLAFVVAACWLFAPLRRAGAWDPFEPDNADLARRIAVVAFGARDLARPGDPATIPTLGDLGRGELPFTSMALSFRVFGFHDWSGRLALALWALAGAMSIYLLMHRLVHPRAAFFSVLALLGMPMFFLEARTMLGDAVTMAAFAMAISGLALALREREAKARLGALALGALGLVAGYLCRGLLSGVAVPCLVVGAAGLLAAPRAAPEARTIAIAFVLLGVASALRFAQLALPIAGTLVPPPRAVGMSLFDATPNDSTFDRVLRQLGHGLFPWSVLLPVSLARLWSRAPGSPAVGRRAESRADDESFARVLLLLAASGSLIASALLAPLASDLPFVGVAALAAVVGLHAHELADGASSRVSAALVVLLALVLWVDLDREPARVLEAVVAPGGVFPASFAEPARGWLRLVAAIFVAGAFFALLESGPPPASRSVRSSFVSWWQARVQTARAIGVELYQAHQGNLVFVMVLLEAALVGLAATLFVGRRSGWPQIVDLPKGIVSAGIAAWWAAPLGVLAAIIGWTLARDGVRALLAVTRLSRGALLVLGGAVAGAVASFNFHPALADQLSPKGVFERFQERSHPGDELALLGTSPRAGALYAEGSVRSFDDVADAFGWLAGAGVVQGGPRRFLVLKAKDLPKLNSLYRGHYKRNVPVIDGRSSQNVLVSDRLEGDRDESPFSTILPAEEPAPQHVLSARFAENLELFGWDLLAPSGQPAASMVPGKAFTLRVYLRVQKPLRGTYKAFLHIDGDGKRYNADHTPALGKYPLNLWQPGDVVVDEVVVTLEPNFTPGQYWAYFGFFQDSKRLSVTEGKEQDDRVVLGPIRVE